MKKLICIILGFFLIYSSFSQELEKKLAKQYLDDGIQYLSKKNYLSAVHFLVNAAKNDEYKNEAFEQLKVVVKALDAENKKYTLVPTNEYKELIRTSTERQSEEFTQIIETLQTENKKIREDLEWYEKQNDTIREKKKVLEKEIDNLQRENFRLKDEKDNLSGVIDKDRKTRDEKEAEENRKKKTYLYIPDPVFKSILLSYYNVDGDEEISLFEAERIFELRIKKQKISSLVGIEKLTNLKILTCSNNKLKSLDVSKNTELKKLVCDGNKLFSLTISGAANLTDLDCSRNKIIKLDCSNNSRLRELNCSNNKLYTLTTVSNQDLEKLDCSNNKIYNIDVSNCRYLSIMNCQKNSLSDLNVSSNTNLANLNCSSNKLTKLDVSNNRRLKKLYCSNNKLSFLNINNGLNFDLLHCQSNSKYLPIIKSKTQERPKDFKYDKKMAFFAEPNKNK